MTSMTDPADRPLWQVMRQADGSVASDFQSPEARMIRAIADWLVPEEPMIVEGGRTYEQGWLLSERERLRLLLLAEADRAEAGND